MKFIHIKHMLIFLLSAAVVLLPAGCSSRDNKKDKSYGKEPDEGLITSNGGKLVSITLCFVKAGSYFSPKAKEQLQAKAGMELNAGLEFMWIDGAEFDQKIKQMIESGQEIDGVYSHGYTASGLAREKLLLDISDSFRQYAPNLYRRFSKQQLAEVSYRGGIYAIPSYFAESNRLCVLIPAELSKKYSIKAIKNYSDYEAYLAAATGKEANFKEPYIEHSTYELFPQAYGYSALYPYMVFKRSDPQTKIVPWEQTPEFSLAVDTLLKWKEAGYIDTSKPLPQSNRKGFENSYLMEPARISGALGYYSSTAKREYDIFPLFTDREWDVLPVSHYVMAVPKTSGNHEKLLAFMEWVHSSQENYDLLIYGVEKEDFTVKNGAAEVSYGSTNHFGWWGSEAFRDIQFDRRLSYEPEGYRQQLVKDAYSSARYPSPFAFMWTDQGRQVYDSMNDLIKQREKSFMAFENALRSGAPMPVDSFIKQQKDAGVDGLVQELQKQWETLRSR